VRLSDIRVLYPNFEGIFQKHVKDARLDIVLNKCEDFKALKVDVVSVWHLREKHGHLDLKTHSALVQALLVEHNLQHAKKLLERADDNTNRPGVVTRIVSFLSGPKAEETFKNHMKTTAAKLPDSQFLQRLDSEDIGDNDLRPTIQNATVLALKELSSSIDAAVKKMTHAILAMEYDHCGMSVKREVENEEKKVLDDARIEFIDEINKKSAGRRNS